MTTYTKPGIRDAVRHFNKHVLNPVMMTVAGSRFWYASVIEHTGRNSGRHYSTPVVAVPVSGGFVVPLPYGTGVDWLRNVLAAGSATITTKGQTYHVERPEVVDAAAVEPELPAPRRKVFHAFDVDSYVRFTLA
ncbi:nitroreductase [Mycobacterium paragordonae]|jgi:deazaflavin-dependent oxidoreductase (nitroreductase family)|uniref:Peptidase n=1 Tax=Mycobacterium paragordonae TaxID=1389713 RepID=A0ABQ1C298_9MYCO|nr:nitroreductase [Mycobacterium paragordonae]AYE95258.1 nitroreductase [Mycobacterium paragordonae]GFG78436.1 peptidase [Mycobacterium paragordonae]